MGMSNTAYKADEAAPNINVTPMIDILLVLLIIFMAISPLKPARFEAKVPAEPKPEEQQMQAKPNPLTLVVSMDNNQNIKLNAENIGNVTDTGNLSQRLAQTFQEREQQGVFREGTNEVEKTVFIKAPRASRYTDVVKVIDAVKAAGAQPIGLQIDDLQ